MFLTYVKILKHISFKKKKITKKIYFFKTEMYTFLINLDAKWVFMLTIRIMRTETNVSSRYAQTDNAGKMVP